ncbi:hypothetical protein PVAND_016947 [Polypedilum vanderplanki]|uniref:Uncharacterized protein n=1 Tax=Polypedilum vanderplanki TaxID=319348 RepID=A0A9J6BHX1_POLVA|nr:hypothetical protein PVAND_016947 [Polypedilum vanderplanki]
MVNDWKENYGLFIGVMLKTFEVVIGAAIFMSTKGDRKLTFEENVVFYFFIVIGLSYHFVPCYYGNLIYTVTNTFGYDLFSSDWTDGNLKYKKAMIVFGENLKQPVALSVSFYENLTLETFQVVKNIKLFLQKFKVK